MNENALAKAAWTAREALRRWIHDNCCAFCLYGPAYPSPNCTGCRIVSLRADAHAGVRAVLEAALGRKVTAELIFADPETRATLAKAAFVAYWTRIRGYGPGAAEMEWEATDWIDYQIKRWFPVAKDVLEAAGIRMQEPSNGVDADVSTSAQDSKPD